MSSLHLQRQGTKRYVRSKAQTNIQKCFLRIALKKRSGRIFFTK